MGLISIVMPVYNGRNYIGQTIDSVLGQSYTNWELICINDSSTDDSLELLDKYAQSDARIKVYTTPNGGSASKATKFGITKIDPQSRYYFYLSQDDIVSGDLFEKCIVRFQVTDAQVVMPDTIWYYEDPKAIKPASQQNDLIGYRGDRSVVISGRTAFKASIEYHIPGFSMIETAVVRKVGFFDFSYNSIDATGKLWLLDSEKVAFCGAKFLYRQDNSGAITKRISPLLFDSLHTNEWLYGYVNTHFGGDRELLGAVKKLQIDDLVSRRAWLFDKGCMPSDKYALAEQKTKKAYQDYKKTGGYPARGQGLKGLVKYLLINCCYATFSCYAKQVTHGK